MDSQNPRKIAELVWSLQIVMASGFAAISLRRGYPMAIKRPIPFSCLWLSGWLHRCVISLPLQVPSHPQKLSAI
jgi:hypothetical protein